MGMCSSCLGLDRHSSGAESMERARLLRQDSQHRHYGANQEEISRPAVDPEQLERERDALERICAQTADNLIDISHADEGTKSASDYARLFNETFPAPMLFPNNSSQVSEIEDERTWLRNIINNDQNDKSWDCNVVHQTHKPLTFNFD